MIIVVCLIIALISLAIDHVLDRRNYVYTSTIALGMAIIAFICVFAMLIIMFFSSAYADTTYAKYELTYEHLTYQLAHDYYDNVVDYGRENLMEQVLAYNSDIICGSIKKRNLWIGCFYHVDYNSLPLIDLNAYNY